MKGFILFIALATLTVLIYSYKLTEPKPTEAYQISYSPNVFARIGGKNYFTLFGYASPQAFVNLEGIGIYDHTIANDKGYFEFHNSFSPFSPREVCLSSQDQLGRISMAVCLPPFQTDRTVSIGPVIIPPTISFNKGDFFVSDEVIVSGQSIPNSTVDLYTFVEKNKINNFVSKLNIIRPVEAINIPKIQTRTDGSGNYSIALPSSDDTTLRLFAQTLFDESPSPKSNTLDVSILPIWMIIVTLLRAFLDSLLARILEVILLMELVLVSMYLLRTWLFRHLIYRNIAIIRRPNELPALVTEHHITVYPR